MKQKNGLHIDDNGSKEWYLNDKCHRTDGPAVEYADGTKEWWVDGKRHRTDGPAIVYADGTKQWCVDGRFLGYNDKGFWALWDCLDDTQRNNINLLLHLPKV